ncbi:hypothetical protein [Runella aurantiaca]|uniref:YkgJ family cysteine cluster protein n=1 Tax=Runella aurantiaca TaxID=2282308 RepID=A0A369I7V0_9BACT|nr:hypothetical protein [Runella aurantiaca]RDB04325.1 hypothetical protein DVG78_19200 [Runella aurantiaca]
MSVESTESPVAEQEICVKCGICCDGTLFNHAELEPGEMSSGSLPKKIEQNYRKMGEKERFVLPCQYFEGKCTIYDQNRAIVCSAFRCQLLKDFSKGRITKYDADKTVLNALKFRNEIFELYKRIFGVDTKLSFRQLLTEIGKMPVPPAEQSKELALLKAQCNIYETLLIKNFKSIKTFKSMIDTTVEQ